jgi:thioredoxin reductase (NADPH)
VVDIKGEDLVQSVVLDSGRELAVDGVFVAVGMTPQTQLLDGIVTLDEQRYVAADETGITDADGFFVAGDVRTKALRQVVTAVSDGANAAISAERYIRENS